MRTPLNSDPCLNGIISYDFGPQGIGALSGATVRSFGNTARLLLADFEWPEQFSLELSAIAVGQSVVMPQYFTSEATEGDAFLVKTQLGTPWRGRPAVDAAELRITKERGALPTICALARTLGRTSQQQQSDTLPAFQPEAFYPEVVANSLAYRLCQLRSQSKAM